MSQPERTKVAWVTTANATMVSVRDGGSGHAPETQGFFSTSAGGFAAPEAEDLPVVEEDVPVEDEVAAVDEDAIPF